MDSADPDGHELQRRVLQSTLQEVAARDTEAEAAECCVICLEAITEPCQALPCGHHNFDYLCVANWLFETPLCPLCKSSVSKVVHGPPDRPLTTSFDEPPAATSRRRQSQYREADAPRFFRGRRTRPWCRSTPRRAGNGDDATNDPVSVRRDVYRRQRFSKHVGSNRLSRYRELTPRMFCNDAELVSRARMFIRRELLVFSFLRPDESDDAIPSSNNANSRTAVEQRRANNAEFLLEYIIAILKSVDIMGSGGQAENMLADFLGRENTTLFLHELRARLRSPYGKLEDWDRAVQYDDSTVAAAQQEQSGTDDTRRSASPKPERSGRRQATGRSRSLQRGRGDFYRPGTTDLRNERRDDRHRHHGATAGSSRSAR